MAKKKKQTTQNQMKKKDKVKKPRREPSPAEVSLLSCAVTVYTCSDPSEADLHYLVQKLAKLEYQMVKRWVTWVTERAFLLCVLDSIM